jgi:hypothetical protein
MASLDLFQRVVVVDKLRSVVKIDQDLDITVRQKTIDSMSVLDSVEIDEQLDKLVQREAWKVRLMDHFGY